jgi:small Trp-rich protein
MWLLGVGIVFLILKTQELTVVATWSWWIILAPFGLAAVWWTYADASGYTKRKAMEREDARVQARIQRQREATGHVRRRK